MCLPYTCVCVCVCIVSVLFLVLLFFVAEFKIGWFRRNREMFVACWWRTRKVVAYKFSYITEGRSLDDHMTALSLHCFVSSPSLISHQRWFVAVAHTVHSCHESGAVLSATLVRTHTYSHTVHSLTKTCTSKTGYLCSCFYLKLYTHMKRTVYCAQLNCSLLIRLAYEMRSLLFYQYTTSLDPFFLALPTLFGRVCVCVENQIYQRCLIG